jgi:hypothetical protein
VSVVTVAVAVTVVVYSQEPSLCMQ